MGAENFEAGRAAVFAAKAFIFDMDGVLADNCGYHLLAWKEFSARHGNELTKEQIIGWMGASNRVYMERILKRAVDDEELARLQDEKEGLYRRLYSPHMRLPDGLRALLDGAHARGVKCAVATGGPQQNVDFLLDGLGLRGDFEWVVDASQYVNCKPAPDCYLRAAELLGVDPAQCMVFEDAVAGIRAGKAAGMRVTAITATNPRAALEAAGADLAIDSFAELAPF